MHFMKYLWLLKAWFYTNFSYIKEYNKKFTSRKFIYTKSSVIISKKEQKSNTILNDLLWIIKAKKCDWDDFNNPGKIFKNMTKIKMLAKIQSFFSRLE